MANNLRFTSFVMLLFCSLNFLLAQEILSPVNRVQNNIQLKQKLSVTLPFFDDFSNYYGVPNSDLWTDSDAFVNTSFAKNPPSVGAAALDAVDATGKLHSGVYYNQSASADKLTSQAMDLTGLTGVYLSFYYQSGGLADAPDETDSLLVEFFSPSTQKWNKIWSAKGNAAPNFTRVMLKIESSVYLTSNFQFRFRNTVSIAGSSMPSNATNADCWNIDYVYLNNNRLASETSMRDLAFSEPLGSIISGFEAVPWKHYKQVNGGLIKNPILFSIANNDLVTRNMNQLTFTISDMASGAETIYPVGSENIQAQTIKVFDPTIPYKITIPENDTKQSAVYNISAKIITDGFDFAGNNLTAYKQVFDNYYAYDDGSAEMGYGISGDGAKSAMLAYKFTPLTADTLKSVAMCFNQTLNNVSQKYFILSVWDDEDGKPGKRIYAQQGYRPEYAGLNTFYEYKFDTVLIIGKPFYVGWEQTTADLLQIGYDANRNAGSYIFYNVSGFWAASAKKGALMIRPVFGKNTNLVQNTTEPEFEQTIHISPNPTQSYMRVEIPDFNRDYSYKILNTIGQTLINGTITSPETEIDLSAFKPGLYLFQLSDSKRFSKLFKIIKQ